MFLSRDLGEELMLDFVPDFEAALPSFLVPVLSFLARSRARDVIGLKSVETLSLFAFNVLLLASPAPAWLLVAGAPVLVLKCDE